VKGYSTKYALTIGIEVVEARPSPGLGADPKYVYTNRLRTQLIVGRNFFECKPDAHDAAIAMAKRKMESLRKQVAKIEGLILQPKWANDE